MCCYLYDRVDAGTFDTNFINIVLVGTDVYVYIFLFCPIWKLHVPYASLRETPRRSGRECSAPDVPPDVAQLLSKRPTVFGCYC